MCGSLFRSRSTRMLSPRVGGTSGRTQPVVCLVSPFANALDKEGRTVFHPDPTRPDPKSRNSSTDPVCAVRKSLPCSWLLLQKKNPDTPTIGDFHRSLSLSWGEPGFAVGLGCRHLLSCTPCSHSCFAPQTREPSPCQTVERMHSGAVHDCRTLRMQHPLGVGFVGARILRRDFLSGESHAEWHAKERMLVKQAEKGFVFTPISCAPVSLSF